MLFSQVALHHLAKQPSRIFIVPWLVPWHAMGIIVRHMVLLEWSELFRGSPHLNLECSLVVLKGWRALTLPSLPLRPVLTIFTMFCLSPYAQSCGGQTLGMTAAGRYSTGLLLTWRQVPTRGSSLLCSILCGTLLNAGQVTSRSHCKAGQIHWGITAGTPVLLQIMLQQYNA